MQKREWIWVEGFAAAAAALALFGWLASQVLLSQTIWFDATIRNAVHSIASPQLTYAMRGITQLGSPITLVVLSLLLVWRLAIEGRRGAAVVLVIAAVGG